MTDIDPDPIPESRREASPDPNFETPVADNVDWRSLDGGEIYDRLIQKGAKLGIQANKMIRRLKRRGHFSGEGASTLAKNKGALTLSFPLIYLNN